MGTRATPIMTTLIVVEQRHLAGSPVARSHSIAVGETRCFLKKPDAVLSQFELIRPLTGLIFHPHWKKPMFCFMLSYVLCLMSVQCRQHEVLVEIFRLSLTT